MKKDNVCVTVEKLIENLILVWLTKGIETLFEICLQKSLYRGEKVSI